MCVIKRFYACYSPLHIAAKSGLVGMVKELINQGLTSISGMLMVCTGFIIISDKDVYIEGLGELSICSVFCACILIVCQKITNITSSSFISFIVFQYHTTRKAGNGPGDESICRYVDPS